MNNLSFSQRHNLKPCDVIITPKSEFEIVQHYVVYLGINSEGKDVYMDNNMKIGVRYISEGLFLKENPKFFSIRRFAGSSYQRNEAIQRAINMQGRVYNLSNFNCEHLANYIQYNTPSSKQSEGWKIVASVLGIALLFTTLR